MKLQLTPAQRKKIPDAEDIYAILQKILLRETKANRNRRNLWIACLNNIGQILRIDRVSMGSIHWLVIEPMEVFCHALQKRAVSIVMIQNCTSSKIFPSAEDKDITARIIQCGYILQVPLKDHLMINEMFYYSFSEIGLLAKLEKNLKYVPDLM